MYIIRLSEDNVEVIFKGSEGDVVLNKDTTPIELTESSYDVEAYPIGDFIIQSGMLMFGGVNRFDVVDGGSKAILNNWTTRDNTDARFTLEEVESDLEEYSFTVNSDDVSVKLEGVNQTIYLESGSNTVETDEDVFDVVVEVIEGYSIDFIQLRGSGKIFSFVISSDGRSAVLEDWNILDYMSLNVDVVEDSIPTIEEYSFTIDNENVNVSLVSGDVTIELDSGSNTVETDLETFDVLVDVKKGFLISSIQLRGSGKIFSFEVASDNKSAILEGWDILDYMTLRVETTLDQSEDEDISGFNNLYLVNREELREISRERFIEGGLESSYDLGDFIINILELPFIVDDDVKGGVDKIQLGSSLLDVEAITILKDELEINIGEIEVPLKYENSFDFMNTTVKLHLPFVEVISLENEFVIGYSISIGYLIDLYSGNSTLNIYSSKTETIIHSQKFTIGRGIPFVTSKNVIRGSLTNSEGLNNKLNNSFVEVIRNVPRDILNFDDDVLKEGFLRGVVGFIKVNEIDLKVSSTLSEKRQIINILKNGVVINED